MAFTIEKILNDAHNLSMRLKEHDVTADSLIARTQTLHRQVEAMKQYQDNLNELNEIARHRPRANLILSLAQENSQIRELQQENKELRESLEEHQTALELIMSKYREQITKLLKADQLEREYIAKKCDRSQEMQEKLDKIYEMAAVMWKAVKIDDEYVDHDQETIAQLKKENASMRELLQISTSCTQALVQPLEEKTTQTEEEELFGFPNHQMEDFEGSDLGSPDGYRSLSCSVIARSLDDSGISTINSTSHESTALPTVETVAASCSSTAQDDAEQAELSAVLQQLDEIADDFEGGGCTKDVPGEPGSVSQPSPSSES